MAEEVIAIASNQEMNDLPGLHALVRQIRPDGPLVTETVNLCAVAGRER